MKTVSVIIPVYNQETFIAEAIESVFQQTIPQNEIEIIVVDDGSTDGTSERLNSYKDRIHVISQANAGVSAARNAGIRQATGKFVCCLDSDDLFLPEKIEKQLAVFQADAEIGMVHTGVSVVRPGETGWEVWYDYIPPIYKERETQIDELLKWNYLVSSSVMVKRELFSQVGLFNESLRYAEDYDMWLRLLTCCRIGEVSEILVHYRWHGSNNSRHNDGSIVDVVREEAAKRFGRT